MGTVLVIAYLAWAFYSGWKFLTGKNEWLDQPETPNKIAKALLGVVVGIFIGAFYFLYRVLKLLGWLDRWIAR